MTHSKKSQKCVRLFDKIGYTLIADLAYLGHKYLECIYLERIKENKKMYFKLLKDVVFVWPRQVFHCFVNISDNLSVDFEEYQFLSDCVSSVAHDYCFVFSKFNTLSKLGIHFLRKSICCEYLAEFIAYLYFQTAVLMSKVCHTESINFSTR